MAKFTVAIKQLNVLGLIKFTIHTIQYHALIILLDDTLITIFNKTPQLAISDILTQLKVFVFVKNNFTLLKQCFV